MTESFIRRAARGTVKPVLYGAIDAVFPRGLPRRVNGEHLRLAIQASRFYPSRYEPDKAEFLRRHCKPHTTAIDVGAHFGVFTVIMARAVGPAGNVIAFEPTPSTREALRKTIADNGCAAWVTVRDEAVSDGEGEHRLFASPYPGDMGNSLVAHGAGATTSIHVRTINLASVQVESPVSCLKIDAEGAEVDILRGSGAMLDEHRPAITVEIHPPTLDQRRQHPGDVWDLLAAHGYRLFRDGSELERASFREEREYFELQALHPEPV